MMHADEKARLLEAAVQGVAWALIEGDTDTSDRGVSEEHYQERVADARRILPELLPDSTDERLIECPHWSPGRITMRKGCTACAADRSTASCEGHACCTARLHEHGCFADLDGSKCNDPKDHPPTGEGAET